MINIDKKITELIYNSVNSNKYIQQLPYYLGLLPYELYVLPGMYIAMLQVIWFSAFNPIQFHLLPHFFAFCLFQLIKGTVGRQRPGCAHKNLSGYIDESHCSGKQRFMSFPSGHTGIAFALATALYLEMTASDDPRFFDVQIKTEKNRKIILGCGFFVASAICIHRISKGYHYIGDTIVGGILGSLIGYISWHVLNKYKKLYHEVCNKSQNCNDNEGLKINYINTTEKGQRIELVGKILLTIPVLYLLIKFFMVDFWHLASVKH